MDRERNGKRKGNGKKYERKRKGKGNKNERKRKNKEEQGRVRKGKEHILWLLKDLTVLPG